MKLTLADYLSFLGIALIIATIAVKADGWWAAGAAGVVCVLAGAKFGANEPLEPPKATTKP